MKWDIYGTIAVQLEAETEEEAIKAATDLPLQYWDDASLDVTEAIGHAD